MASINVGNLSISDFTPGSYISVNFAQGPFSGLNGPKTALLMGNCTASSFAATNNLVDGYVFGPGQQYAVNSAQDVINYFGAGSELHRGYLQFTALNPNSPVFLLAVKENTVNAQASLSVTIGGATSASANGLITVFVANGSASVGFAIGDIVTSSTVPNLVAAINSNTSWGVTAAQVGSTNVLTITAKQHGGRGNKIRVAVQIQGTASGITSSAQNFGFLAGGGLTEASWTNALATIDPRYFDYIIPAALDCAASGGNTSVNGSSGLGDLYGVSLQVSLQAQPLPGLRQRVVAGQFGDIATTAVTNAQLLNNPLVDIVCGGLSCNLTPFELAAALASAFCALEVGLTPQLNWDWLGNGNNDLNFSVLNPFDGTTTSHAEIAAALVGGVTPVVAGVAGQSYVVSAITSYSINPLSGTFDPRTRDHHIVTVCDLGANLIQQMWVSNDAGKLLADDPVPGARPPGSSVLYPSIVASQINKIITDMGSNDLLQNVAASIAATQVVRETQNDGRVSANVQLTPISLFHQLAVNVNQVQ